MDAMRERRTPLKYVGRNCLCVCHHLRNRCASRLLRALFARLSAGLLATHLNPTVFKRLRHVDLALIVIERNFVVFVNVFDGHQLVEVNARVRLKTVVHVFAQFVDHMHVVTNVNAFSRWFRQQFAG